MSETLPPIQITQQAVGDNVKGVAEDLEVSVTSIYKMLSDEGYDVYGRFLALHKSLKKRNPDGAELLFRDFKGRHESNQQFLDTDRDIALQEALTILAEAVGSREQRAQLKIHAARIIRVMEWIISHEGDE